MRLIDLMGFVNFERKAKKQSHENDHHLHHIARMH